MNQDAYTKKVVIFDVRSSPEARAKRLRQLRNIANMTRDQMCETGNIAMSSLKRWELAYYGGLPIDGARKIIQCVAQKGVICSLDWLLHEVGSPPLIDQQFREKSFNYTKNSKNKFLYPPSKEEQFIINELLLFRKHHPGAIDLKINDDGLYPKYKINDYVAGVQIPLEHIESLLNQDCIVQIQNGKILLRNLRQGIQNNTYNLICTNEQTMVKEPIIYNAEITMIAAILRHYRRG